VPDVHWEKSRAITKRAQSGLSRANYYLGGSRLEVKKRRNNRTGQKAGETIYEERL
jgi:hypothetical protein